MADSVNQYGMTQAQWNQYQANQIAQPEWARVGPEQWQWREGINEYAKYQHATPNKYDSYVSSAWVANQAASNAAAQQAAANAAKIRNVDPQKTSGYKFEREMSDAWTEVYLKEKKSNPSLTI